MHSASLLQALPAPPRSSSAQGSPGAARLNPGSQTQPVADDSSCSPQGAQSSAALARSGRHAEVGRMMVRRAWRARPRVVIELMRAALAVALDRGASHLLTAVFEGETHSPLDFHVRQLGFERIGSHERGELNCANRRILLRLDLRRAFERLGRRRGVAAEVARGLEERLAGGVAAAVA